MQNEFNLITDMLQASQARLGRVAQGTADVPSDIRREIAEALNQLEHRSRNWNHTQVRLKINRIRTFLRKKFAEMKNQPSVSGAEAGDSDDALITTIRTICSPDHPSVMLRDPDRTIWWWGLAKPLAVWSADGVQWPAEDTAQT